MKIFDASTLIAIFHEGKCESVLEESVKNGYALGIPETVYEELKVNKITFKLFSKYSDHFEVLPVNKKCIQNLKKRHPNLHDGELGVMCHAIEENDKNLNIYFVDDGEARQKCEVYDIRKSGLIGYLLWNKDKEILDNEECKRIYKNLKESPFRISEKLLGRLIE